MFPKSGIRVIKLFPIGFLLLCAFLWLGNSDATLSTLEVVDGYLDDAISKTMVGSPLSSVRGPDFSPDHQKAQDALACYIEAGNWEYPAPPMGPRRFTQQKMMLRYIPPSSCFGDQLSFDPSPTAQFCALLRGKEILFVGPDTTFYLHTLWLNALSIQDSRTHTCWGLISALFIIFARVLRQGQKPALQTTGARDLHKNWIWRHLDQPSSDISYPRR
ncbi:hypothetical protein BD779DRAFT_1669405 [Infundibulicybe gibba]|nr:hypothetical protein BD779DRAFT_1669405 [Infundibulicybe gibba]